MEDKTCNIVIGEDGVQCEMTGLWTRRDLDAAKYHMVKKLQEKRSEMRTKVREDSDGRSKQRSKSK